MRPFPPFKNALPAAERQLRLANMESRTGKKKRLKGYGYRVWNSRFGRCLAPGSVCLKPPIRAHSVQRQGSMRLLSSGGHVIMLRQRFDLKSGPTISFHLVGVRNATVFTGLCAQHDFDLFKRIDREFFRMDDVQCLFLQAYRAILRETHVCLEFAAKLQSVYQKQCDLGLVDRNVPSRGSLSAVQRIVVAYETWLYKESIDRAFQQGNVSIFSHDVLDLGQTGACIGVSSLFSLDEAQTIHDAPRVALNVIPVPGGNTYAILSYIGPDKDAARTWLNPVLTAAGRKQRYLLSRLVLERSDNIVINPQLYTRLNHDRREVIRHFFAATVLRNDGGFHDERLNLFDIEVA